MFCGTARVAGSTPKCRSADRPNAVGSRKKRQNAEGVPEISRGLSDQPERYPRSTFKTSRTLEGCKNVLSTTPVVRPLQGREICLSSFPGESLRQPPANFSHPFRMPEYVASSSRVGLSQDSAGAKLLRVADSRSRNGSSSTGPVRTSRSKAVRSREVSSLYPSEVIK